MLVTTNTIYTINIVSITTNMSSTTRTRWTTSLTLPPWKGYIEWSENFRIRTRGWPRRWQQWIGRTIRRITKPAAIGVIMTALEMKRRTTSTTLVGERKPSKWPLLKAYYMLWPVLGIHYLNSSSGELSAIDDIEVVWWNWRSSTPCDHVSVNDVG